MNIIVMTIDPSRPSLLHHSEKTVYDLRIYVGAGELARLFP